MKSSSLTSSLVRVTLRSETQSVTKTLPKTMELSRLTLLIKRLFNTGDVEHSLYYRSTQVTISVCCWCISFCYTIQKDFLEGHVRIITFRYLNLRIYIYIMYCYILIHIYWEGIKIVCLILSGKLEKMVPYILVGYNNKQKNIDNTYVL